MHDISTEVVLAGGRYRTDGSTIRFSETEIDLGQMTFFDAANRKADLSGKISHSYLDSIQMNMRMRTDGLQILNTTREDNQLYYGKLFAKADVRITGTPDLPRLDIVATTLDSSLLHVEPLTEQLAVVHEDMGQHILTHALCQVSIDKPHQRLFRQCRVLHQRIHACPERENGLQVRQPFKGIRLRFPDIDIVDL